MSDRGVGLVGKHNKTIRSVEEINHDAKAANRLKKTKQFQRGEKINSAVAGGKRAAFEAIGGKTNEGGFGSKFAGGAYHDIDTSDPRKMTYSETLGEQKQDRESAATQKTIDLQVYKTITP